MRFGVVPVLPLGLTVLGLFACTASKPPEDAESTRGAASQPSTAGKGETPQDRDQRDADGVVRRGEALSEASPMTVEAVLARAESLDGQPVKVEGTVGRVCGKSGCWFELKGENAPTGIRITSKGYRFFVPSTAGGLQATLEGDLKVQKLDVETAQHYADDAAEGTGRPAARVTAPVAEVSIAAVGLEMRAPRQDG